VLNHADRPEATSRFVDDYILSLLARASHVLSAEFHGTLRRRGVPIPVWRVLASLAGVGDDTVTGLAATCLLQQPTMTKLLDRMVRDSLVHRVSDPRDRRVVRIRLLPKGEALLSDLLPLARNHEAEVAARLLGLDVEQLKAMLRGIASEPARARRPASLPVPA
jgi:DNA-binding MarR family transcriptional regulator